MAKRVLIAHAFRGNNVLTVVACLRSLRVRHQTHLFRLSHQCYKGFFLTNPMSRTALVLGSSGTGGGALVPQILQEGYDNIICLGRSKMIQTTEQTAAAREVLHKECDLINKESVKLALQDQCITHIFFAASFNIPLILPMESQRLVRMSLKLTAPLMRFRAVANRVYQEAAKNAGATDPNETTLKMLRNVIEVCNTAPHHLQHVCLLTGGRYNGVHLGPHLYRGYRSPVIEDAPCPGPCFYFELEAYLKSQQKDVPWTVVRPHYIIGFSKGRHMNLTLSMFVYAAILKELGQPLVFPSDHCSAKLRVDFADSREVAKLMCRAVDDPSAHNQAFNCVNGLVATTWSNAWKQLAEVLEMEPTFPKKGLSNTRKFFEKHEATWLRIAKKHGLEVEVLQNLVKTEMFQSTFLANWDSEYSRAKLKEHGLENQRTLTDSFAHTRQLFQQAKLIP